MDAIRIALTLGEPAGIGPDLAIQIAQHGHAHELIVIGDGDMLEQRAQALGLPLQLQNFEVSAAPTATPRNQLLLIDQPLAHACNPGTLDPRNAGAVLKTLDTAVELCCEQVVGAMVTAPIQKSMINDGGIAFSGHTEYLAALTETERVVMMLATAQMRVALATTHLPLAQVPGAISGELLQQVLTIVEHDLRTRFGCAQPRIAVLGLNPHAGESGHMGREEIDIIEPALNELRSRGMHLQGPLPADTAFNPKVLESCDAVLALYHDQGLPVLKYAGFGQAVNITLGLPIIRTSVDHGTALDLAGTGTADAGSLLAAIDYAVTMAQSKV